MMPIDLEKYPLSELDQQRAADLARILPPEGRTVLDVGASWGYFSEYLSTRFEHVTALDLERPTWELPGVTTVAGDITRLQFPDGSFDCVFCTEVLEHVPDVSKAASELARVSRKHVVVGVPFEQDLRIGRLTCVHCEKVNPPNGHVHSFTEERLRGLFSGLELVTRSLVLPVRRERTNALSVWLLDRARNPYGNYNQSEPCLYCGAKFESPGKRTLVERICSFAAYRLNRLQRSKPSGWIHMVFRKG